jgi:tetratricopeptide (TPR) repeat protein
VTPIPRARRLACAIVAIAAADVLFHAQLADALVTRGDDAFRNGDVAGALRAYDRATRIDPRSEIAADRLAFFLTLRHDRDSAARAVAIASVALAARPDDAALAADRGFAEMQLRRWNDAERDFAAAGLRGRDARYDHLAARMALRRGDRGAARAYAARAIAADPAFRPAYALLRSIE